MALLYTTPPLTIRHNRHHRSEIYDAGVPDNTHALELLRFCFDGVHEYFELPQSAKCIRFDVWEGAKPDRIKITQDGYIYFCIEGDLRQYIEVVAHDVLTKFFKKRNVLYVGCTYE